MEVNKINLEGVELKIIETKFPWQVNILRWVTHLVSCGECLEEQ